MLFPKEQIGRCAAQSTYKTGWVVNYNMLIIHICLLWSEQFQLFFCFIVVIFTWSDLTFTETIELRSQLLVNSCRCYDCWFFNVSLLPTGAFDYMERKSGGVDIVCNNAGISAMDSDVERSIQAVRINLVNYIILLACQIILVNLLWFWFPL